MNEPRRHILLGLFRLFDIGVMLLAFVVAAGVLDHATPAGFGSLLSMRIKVSNFFLMLILIGLWNAAFTQFGLYRSRRIAAQEQEIRDILKSTMLGTGILGIAKWVFNIRLLPLDGLPLFFLICTASIVVSRLLLRAALRWIRIHGRNLRHVLLVGTDERSTRLARKLESRLDLGYRIVGFANDGDQTSAEFAESGYRVVCGIHDIREFLRHDVVDEVIVTLPEWSSFSTILDIEAVCDEQGVIVRRLAQSPESSCRHINQVEGEVFLRNGKDSLDSWGATLKRGFDLVGATVLLICCAPAMIAAAVAIKLTSRGPVLFTQERVGLHKRTFRIYNRIYKFRSMVPDAEKLLPGITDQNEVSGPVFKIRKDPRITRVGNLLRKTSIDELPQLVNVIKGDMSLVGPRPLPLRDYAGFSEDSHRRRLSVRPGITCSWQVQGRSSVPFEQWMRLDLEYIDNWSFWLDMRILLKTVPAVLKGSGAA
jgi:exopolysaccharide biosynthesis polyprenyl glycosylphosphotransferase